MDVTVRPAEPDDVRGILSVAEAGWTAAYGDFLDEETIEAAMAEWYDPATTRELVDREDVAYHVAVRESTGGVDDGNDSIVGYVSGGPADEDGVATLGAIYVDPDHWGEGVGSALLERFERFCRREGYDEIEFQVLSENDVGTAFYRSHGYEVVEERETDLFGQPVRERTVRGRVE